jgi:hypothetical protein
MTLVPSANITTDSDEVFILGGRSFMHRIQVRTLKFTLVVMNDLFFPGLRKILHY